MRDMLVVGAVKAIKGALPALRAAPQASIVLFSSVAASTGMAMHASIAAAEGAVEGLTKSLAAIVRFVRRVGPKDRADRRIAVWRLRRRCRDDCRNLAHTTVDSGQRIAHTPQSNHDTNPH